MSLRGSGRPSPPSEAVYDVLLLPALGYAERDCLEHRLSPEEEAAVIETARELIADADEFTRCQASTASPVGAAESSVLGPRVPVPTSATDRPE